ncbi:hypothetical protein DAPPUDRAFT_332698 [Daphnia pulex]|uniref:Uncharacterized protein n=1 Tax=Daphnia pulex TaxID=6669 RepID=E9HQP9_DAPPU|nr:hypothetical protein DAPPUDRAFT_332698 [Daphnia pulex]|eukprot:EFX65933.1 hypothetical protein DAPPUDRAFT_332698 [Daphnia pulex]
MASSFTADQVRGLPDLCTDADELFIRWRMCSDNITCNHDLYVFWKDVCMLIERQCLYIEQKATFFTLLNSGKKEICFVLSPVLIQEVEGYLQELHVYENVTKHYQMEDVVRDFTREFFQHHSEKMAAKH